MLQDNLGSNSVKNLIKINNLQSQLSHLLPTVTRWLSDSSELGNIHCGFVSGSVSFVGGIVGEPTAVKVFL